VEQHQLNRLLWWSNLIVRVASWILPPKIRLEWRREWQSEIWHWCHFLVESNRLTLGTEQELIRHCWGAFADAFWHRFDRAVVLRLLDETPRSPRFCLLSCLALLALLLLGHPAAFFFDMIAPFSYSYADPGHLLTASLSEDAHWLQPETLRNSAERWPRQTQTIASSAVFAWRPSVVSGPDGTETIFSARVAAGMFTLLGARPSVGRVFQESDSSQCQDCVLLSNMLWRSQFHRNPQVIGRSLFLDRRSVTVIGVLPPDFRFPARDISVYRLFDAGPHPNLPRFEWPGVLLRVPARLETRTAKRELEDLINRAGSLPPGTKLRLSSLNDLENQALKSWAALFLLALLSILAIKLAQFLRLRKTGPRAGMRADFHWYLFFAAKTGLLLLAALIASLELSHLVVSRSSISNAYPVASVAAIWCFLFGTYLALTWSIRDQFSRCRVCLRGLGLRVNLASPGRILIDLTGDELVCDEGHGMLHIPVMESGCVDSERWTYLDESWQVLLGHRETRIQLS